MEFVFSYLFEDKPQSYRSWNALCPRKTGYVHHVLARLPLSAGATPLRKLAGGRCASCRPLRPRFSVVALCGCCVWGKALPKKRSSGFSPCNSVEKGRGLPSYFTGRKSLRFCDLKFSVQKFLALFLAFNIRERTRSSGFTCTCLCFASIARMQKLADGHYAWIACPVLAEAGQERALPGLFQISRFAGVHAPSPAQQKSEGGSSGYAKEQRLSPESRCRGRQRRCWWVCARLCAAAASPCCPVLG